MAEETRRKVRPLVGLGRVGGGSGKVLGPVGSKGWLEHGMVWASSHGSQVCQRFWAPMPWAWAGREQLSWVASCPSR